MRRDFQVKLFQVHMQRSFGRREHDGGNCDLCNVARTTKSPGSVAKGEEGEKGRSQQVNRRLDDIKRGTC